MEEEKLLQNVNKVGNYLMDELRRIEGIKEVRGRGLMIGIEFEDLSRKYATGCSSRSTCSQA